MRAVATIVLRDTTGGALYTTHITDVVPPNGTQQMMGMGTVPNEVAIGSDHWTIDIAWDPESLPAPTSPLPPPEDEDTGIAPILVPDHLGRVRLVDIDGKEVEATGSPTTSDARAGAVRLGDDGDLIEPVLVHRANPEYPESARRAGIRGIVIIEAVVMPNGTLADPKILRGLPTTVLSEGIQPYPLELNEYQQSQRENLHRLTLEAVAKWTFEPGYKDGQPVPFILTFTIAYNPR